MLQRLLPVFIREYLPYHVVDPLIALSKWFQKLCCRELKTGDILQMKEDIVMILCKLERIFPPQFFTIMVHLMIHLPDQVLLKGPVNYNWMFPIERQLGHYKKSVRNARYPEGCIAEHYIVQECVTFCKFYMDDLDIPSSSSPSWNNFNISIFSEVIKPDGYLRKVSLGSEELDVAHWCVMEHCKEARYFIEAHMERFWDTCPNASNESRIKHFHSYFLNWIIGLKVEYEELSPGSKENSYYSRELHILARRPLAHFCYSHCYVNGVKFVVWERDRKLKTQNSGVMVETDDATYYGILESVIELKYTDGMSVVVFKCQWFNTDPKDNGSTILDHGLLSVDTSSRWYEDSPYCLATTARQVFYLDDSKAGGSWKVVNVVSQRGTYSASSLAMNEYVQDEEPYQENDPAQIFGNNFNGDQEDDLQEESNDIDEYMDEEEDIDDSNAMDEDMDEEEDICEDENEEGEEDM